MTTYENDSYKGMWENDKMHGEGTLEYSNGEKYIGEFVKGLRHGYGKYWNKEGELKYQG